MKKKKGDKKTRQKSVPVRREEQSLHFFKKMRHRKVNRSTRRKRVEKHFSESSSSSDDSNSDYSIASNDSLSTRRAKLVKHSLAQVRELLNELVRNYENTYVQFVQSVQPTMKRSVYKTLLKFDGQDGITVIDHRNEPCIELKLDETNLVLDDYYYQLKGDCKTYLSHDDFFVLLDFLAYIYDVDLKLQDASSKELHCAKLSKNLLCLAKGRTFYNLYGFTNSRFQQKMQALETQNAVDFLTMELDSYLDASPSDVSNLVEEAHELFPFTERTKMREFVQLILEHIETYCKSTEKNRLLKRLIDLTEKQIKSYLKHGISAMQYSKLNSFKKPKKTIDSFPFVSVHETGALHELLEENENPKPAYVVTFHYEQ